MNKLAKILLTLAPITLAACSSSDNADNSRLCARDNGDFYECEDMAPSVVQAQNDPSLFNTNVHFNLLSEYTEQMAADLQNDLRNTEIDEAIVVASFVYFDDNLQTTSALGNQLAEFFINDLQSMGLPVSDHKLTGMLNINSNGDFAFSRDIDDLYGHISIGYVLTGTMIQNERGIVVNARMVNFKSNKVVASSSKFFPNVIVAELL